MTQEETDAMKGTHELEAAPENERYPDPSHPIDEDNVTMLAKTGDTWNTVYPGCNSTYQYIYDAAFN